MQDSVRFYEKLLGFGKICQESHQFAGSIKMRLHNSDSEVFGVDSLQIPDLDDAFVKGSYYK
jgi:hypothetical protein